MRQIKASAYFLPLFLSMFFLTSITVTQPLRAQGQAPAAGTSVTVRMIEGIDSSKDPAGKQYRASVTKAVDAGNGITIAQGAVAAVTLENSGNGSGWTTRLVSVTVNGQPLAVTTGTASVTTPAQSAADGALRSVNSVLGGFGHHINAPAAAATAVAAGQRVVLPPGVTLSFVLSQPPAAAAAPMVASSAPASNTAPSAVAAPGQDWWLCQYQDKKDPYKPAAGSRMYFSVFPTGAAFLNDHWKHFNAYVQQNYTIMDPSSVDKGFCRRSSNDAATRANSMDMFLKQWRSSNIEPIQVDFANTPAQDAAIDAKLGRGAQPPSAPTVNSKECAYHATCGPQAPTAQPSAAPAPKPAAPSLSASVSAQPFYTLCRYQGQQGGHFIIYVTPIIHWSLSATDISEAFNRFMSANYDINKITAGSGYCQTVSYSADQQAYTMQQLEKQWADSKTVVTHLDWTATPDEIAADNAKLTAKAANAPPPKPHICRPGDRNPACAH
jgi:hypothetical protein